MYTSCQNSNAAKYALIHVLILSLFTIPGTRWIFASEGTPNKAGAMVLVLEDCDSDNNLLTPPNRDLVTLLNSKGEPVRKFYGSGINGGGFISASADGRYFIVFENVQGRLTMYETATSKVFWSLWMDIKSAVFANDMIYAVNAHNTFVIDKTGTIVKHARFGGLDIAVDIKHDCLWIVGLDVKKCDLDLKIDTRAKLTLDTTHAGGFSVDVNRDGSVWVAERDVSEKYGSRNRLVKISPDGNIPIIIDLDFSPASLRIDKSNGSIWTTGRTRKRDFSKIGDDWPETVDELNGLVITKTETFISKYDSEGNLVFKINKGGYSIELDPTDGSAWIAGEKDISHYSANGQQLGSYTGSSDSRKSLAVIPGNNSK